MLGYHGVLRNGVAVIGGNVEVYKLIEYFCITDKGGSVKVELLTGHKESLHD